MFTLVLFVILLLLYASFATQNTQGISITFGSTNVIEMPLYLVIGISLLLGLVLSWIMNLTDMIISNMKLWGKDHTIKDANKTITELTRSVHQLELKNAKLEAKLQKEDVDEHAI